MRLSNYKLNPREKNIDYLEENQNTYVLIRYTINSMKQEIIKREYVPHLSYKRRRRGELEKVKNNYSKLKKIFWNKKVISNRTDQFITYGSIIY